MKTTPNPNATKNSRGELVGPPPPPFPPPCDVVAAGGAGVEGVGIGGGTVELDMVDLSKSIMGLLASLEPDIAYQR